MCLFLGLMLEIDVDFTGVSIASRYRRTLSIYMLPSQGSSEIEMPHYPVAILALPTARLFAKANKAE